MLALLILMCTVMVRMGTKRHLYRLCSLHCVHIITATMMATTRVVGRTSGAMAIVTVLQIASAGLPIAME